MNLVDDIDLIPALRRAVRNFLPNLPNIVHTIVRCRVNLYDIHGSSSLNSPAGLTLIAWTSVHGMLAIHRLSQYLSHCCLSCAACSAKQVRMSNSVGLYLICQCCNNVFLAFDI